MKNTVKIKAESLNDSLNLNGKRKAKFSFFYKKERLYQND